jgi:RNA polymerase sigma-70 factor (ECF subfamily)
MTPSIDQTNFRVLHARGREAWPAIELDVRTFSALAARSVGAGAFHDVHSGDLYLVCACLARVSGAIEAFDTHYLSKLAPILLRRGRDAAAAADVVQTVRVRFLVGESGRGPRLADYDGRGSLMTWLRVALIRTAISARRKHHREVVVDDDHDDILVTATHSAEIDLLRHEFTGEFRAAFRTTFEGLDPRERNLLRYQIIERFGIDRIATIYGVHRATAARWLVSARAALIEGVRNALKARLRITTDDLDSLARVLASKLELSVRLFLTPTP